MNNPPRTILLLQVLVLFTIPARCLSTNPSSSSNNNDLRSIIEGNRRDGRWNSKETFRRSRSLLMNSMDRSLLDELTLATSSSSRIINPLQNRSNVEEIHEINHSTKDDSNIFSPASSSSSLMNNHHDNNNNDNNDEKNSIQTQLWATVSSLLYGNKDLARSIRQWSWKGVQLGVTLWLIKAFWNAMGKVFDEMLHPVFSASRSGDFMSLDDLPYLHPEAVDVLVRSEYQPEARSSPLLPTAATRELARRLVSSGLPLVSLSNNNHETRTSSVESILKSLTRTEAQILSSTLWTPRAKSASHVYNQQQHQEEDDVDLWRDIGGLTNVKEALLELLLVMEKQRQQQQQQQHEMTRGAYGSLWRAPPGVLLYGPPGCGKTLLAKALATEARARILCIGPSTLIRKYVGDSSLRLRALWSVARKISPCILLLDEVDGLFGERNRGNDVHRDLKTEFMQLWDGMLESSTETTPSTILVVGTTNRPFDVDSAFLRRMPRSFYVGLPNEHARKEILHNKLRHIPLEADFDLEEIARRTEGYSPSDLEEVLRAAALAPLRDAIATKQKKKYAATAASASSAVRPLTTQDVLRVRGVTPTQMTLEYRSLLMQYAQREGHLKHDATASTTSMFSNILDLGTIVVPDGDDDDDDDELWQDFDESPTSSFTEDGTTEEDDL